MSNRESLPREIPEFMRFGNTDDDQFIESLTELNTAIRDNIENTLRTIHIFTPDMERTLYDSEEFSRLLLNFARGNRHANIQILAQDLDNAIEFGHALIRLSQQLTSYIEIRTPEDNTITQTHAFILFDNSGFVFRSDFRKYSGLTNSKCKHRNERLKEVFELAWFQARVEPRIKRLSI